MRLTGVKEEDLGMVASRLVEGLRGDAFNAAMEIGVEALKTSKGLEELIKLIRSRAFPLSSVEAKHLIDQGNKPGGVMCRQQGESMTSYVDRRKKWWKMI